MSEKTRHDEKSVQEDGGERGGDVQFLQSEDHHDDGDEGVGQRTDFQLRGADEELGWGGFEKNEIEFSVADQLREFDQAGHQEGGENLLDELVGGHEDNHLGAAPPGDGIDVLVNDIDKGELQNEPGQFHDHPNEKICAKGELARGGIPELDQPQAEKMKERSHFIRQRRCICAGRLAKGNGREG